MIINNLQRDYLNHFSLWKTEEENVYPILMTKTHDETNSVERFIDVLQETIDSGELNQVLKEAGPAPVILSVYMSGYEAGMNELRNRMNLEVPTEINDDIISDLVSNVENQVDRINNNHADLGNSVRGLLD